ncbi:Nitrogen regulatory protein [Methylobacterium crusticola]|uniref:Nitrogen regulatory protein n=1 Tax=Methylobacterium crusticola TaxID=1697972 RepID=A0ABQ4RAU9_9HYPH|nr:PTS sugar transporter subunit IIA [Methylobacterium crusticola]GJD53995.1 Nitrogen regulatory protein [Methylobacterium crusticola]
MIITDFLAPHHVVLDVRAPDKRRLLEDLAGRAAAALGLDAGLIQRALEAREALGSTGIGSGIALPHARLTQVTRPTGLMLRLRPAIAFEAIDEQPVDLVFLLLIPTEAPSEPLNALACVARRLRDPAVVGALRQVRDPAAFYAVLTEDR